MRTIKNLFDTKERSLSYATGLVKPKTTALFFDKIWVPDEEAKINHVPSSLRLPGIDEDEVLSNMYSKAILPNRYPGDLEGVFSRASMVNKGDSFNDVYSLWNDAKNNNIVCSNNYLKLIDFDNNEHLARQAYSLEIENMRDKDGFLTSYNRNEAIRLVSNLYLRHGIELCPVFIERTAFENSLLMQGPLGLQDSESEILHELYRKVVPERDANAVVVTVQSIPTIVEESLSWNQVKEIRKDKKAIKDLRRFRAWASQNLEGKSQDEVTDILGTELDDYTYALKKHGVLTSVGGFTTILSMASTVAGAIEGSQAELVAAGLTVSAGVITFSAQQLYSYFDTRRQPIAYIYDIFDKTK